MRPIMNCTICDRPLQQNRALKAKESIWDLLLSGVAIVWTEFRNADSLGKRECCGYQAVNKCRR